MARLRDVTIICTVKNEIGGLDALMSSILNQTIKPREVIVVDGGSTDGTWKRLKDWKEIFLGINVKMVPFQKKGINIAEGRNIAIKKSSSEWIASIDGGCVARRDWLEKLMEKEGDVISGNFKPMAKSFSEKVQAVFVKRSTARNPSSRSVMFKKTCWKRAGGYPEHLYTGEDTAFNAGLEKIGCKFRVADDAVVMWRMRSTTKKWLRQYFAYGKGDGQAGLDFHTLYGRKAASLILGFYSFITLTIFFPKLILLSFALSAAYGIKKSPGIYGLAGGLLFPFRLGAYIVGFHAGLIDKYRQ